MNAQTIALPELLAVPIDQLKEHPLNARKHFDSAAMAELTDSIREKGIKTPLLVRPNGNKGYEVIAGHRRLRCAKDVGLAMVPVLIERIDDDTALELMLIDNLQREGLHPLEEAEGYKHLLQSKSKYDVERIAKRVGRSIKYVYDRVKLLQLTKDMQKIFHAGEISAGHAIIIARLSAADQARLLDEDERWNSYRNHGHPPLFEGEETAALFDPDSEEDEPETRKPIGVRELQAWVNEHVKLEAGQVEPMLFPETAATLEQAQATEEKVVRITHETITPQELKDGPRAILANSWQRADGKRGSKTCDRSVIGMLVIGPMRGDTLRVCVDKKKCATHWPGQVKAAKKRAAAAPAAAAGKSDKAEAARVAREAAKARKEREEKERRELEASRWTKAVPAIFKATAAAVKKAAVGPSTTLGKFVIQTVTDNVTGAWGDVGPKPKTAEETMRYFAVGFLIEDLQYAYGRDEGVARIKDVLGLDLQKVVDEAVPLEARCRECGCTEKKACKVEDLDGTIEGCSWIEKPDPKTGLGLCSAPACAGKRKASASRKARKK